MDGLTFNDENSKCNQKISWMTNEVLLLIVRDARTAAIEIQNDRWNKHSDGESGEHFMPSGVEAYNDAGGKQEALEDLYTTQLSTK